MQKHVTADCADRTLANWPALWPIKAAGYSGTIGRRGVPVKQMQRKACKQLPVHVVLVHEFSRVSSARINVLLDPQASFKLDTTYQCRWLHPVRSMAHQSRTRGVICLTSNGIGFYDRDVSTALSIRRCAAGPAGPELSSWSSRPAMPNPGSEGQEWGARARQGYAADVAAVAATERYDTYSLLANHPQAGQLHHSGGVEVKGKGVSQRLGRLRISPLFKDTDPTDPNNATPAFAATHMRAGMFLAMRQACKRAREYGVLHDPYALCHLIRAFVLPLGLYGSQVWGTAFLGHGVQLSNPVQTRMLSFLRFAARVRSSVSGLMVLHELGQLPLQLYWLRAACKFWNTAKLSHSDLLMRVIKADVELGRRCQASCSAQFQLAARELMGGEFPLSPDMVLGTKAMEVKCLE
ncbi:hypothetical protein QJQ45_026536, partial [Haematococcus lacustris]